MKCDKLKGKLVEKKMTYSDCAKILDISTTAFSQKINGRVQFTVTEASKLCEALTLPKEERLDIFL